MQVFVNANINDIYSTSYKTDEGEIKNAYNLEIRNKDSRSKYDRYYTLNIDSEAWTRLNLDKDKDKYISKNCEILCRLGQYQNNTFITVVNLVAKN